MNNKAIHKIIISLFMLLILTSCWDKVEIDERAYVLAIGLDKAENEGQINISFLIINPELAAQNEGGLDESHTLTFSFETNDFISAKNIANTMISKEISYDMLSQILISEALAYDDDLIRQIYDAAKDMEIRRDANIVVTKEETSEYLMNNKSNFDISAHIYFKLVYESGVRTAMIPDGSQLLYYYRITEADADLFLATYSTTENPEEEKDDLINDEFKAGELPTEGDQNKAQFAGSAVFKKGKMIGTLTGDETRTAAIMNNTLKVSNILTTYQDPFDDKYRVTAKINSNGRNNIIMDFKSDPPKIHVKIPLIIDILTNHSMTDYAFHEGNRTILKESIKKDITKKANNLVKRSQEEFKANPFGWSLIARKKFSTIPKYKEFNWMESYPDMKVIVSVDIRFGHFGRQSLLPDLNKVRD